MTTFITNAFSINMLKSPAGANVSIDAIDPVQVATMALDSAIGHADTAAVVGSVLGVDIPMNRVSLSLDKGQKVVVAQMIGPRLPEGATTLPDGARIDFFLVSIN